MGRVAPPFWWPNMRCCTVKGPEFYRHAFLNSEATEVFRRHTVRIKYYAWQMRLKERMVASLQRRTVRRQGEQPCWEMWIPALHWSPALMHSTSKSLTLHSRWIHCFKGPQLNLTREGRKVYPSFVVWLAFWHWNFCMQWAVDRDDQSKLKQLSYPEPHFQMSWTENCYCFSQKDPKLEAIGACKSLTICSAMFARVESLQVM